MFSFCANLLDINERCAPSSNKMLASVHLPFTLTGATAVFNKQMVLLPEDSGGMMAAVPAVDVVSVLLVSDGFGSVTVCDVASGF